MEYDFSFLLLLFLISWKTVLKEKESFHMEIVLIGFHFLLIDSLTIITILVNTYEDAVIWNLWATSSELAIVKRKKYFNIMTGL